MSTTTTVSAPALDTAALRRRRNFALFAALLGWMFDGLEMGIFPLIARPALLQMATETGTVNDSFVGQWMGIVTAAFLVGAAVGGFLFGWIGDRIGRVRALSLSILTYSLFTALVYLAQEPWHLGVFRFLSALGMGGEWALGVALVMEIWPEKTRPVLAGLIGAAGNFGFFMIAMIGFFFSVTQDSWRWVALIGALPALLIFFIRLCVPESEKWVEASQKAPTRPVREILSGGFLGRTIIATLLASVALIGTWGSVQWLPLWADKLTGGIDHDAKAITQALSAFGAILGCLIGAWIGARVGRRPAYFVLCLGSLVSSAILFRTVDSYGASFLFFVFLVGGVTAAFYGWLPLYLPELFPTRVRTTAQGFAYNTGRIFAAVGALQNAALMQYFHGSYAQAGAVITLVYVAGMILIWFAPETKNRTLPE